LINPSVAHIRDCLRDYQFNHDMDGAELRAAVAAIFRDTDGEPEILFIKRADKAGDPWSGQMAFPGGHIDPQDESTQHAAERETREEIGLDLTRHGNLLGAIDLEQPVHRQSGAKMAVAPFVYALTSEPARYEPNYEVAEIHWAKVGPMLRHETVTSIDWDIGSQTITMPGFDVSGRIVWGLTFRMLNRLFSLIHPEFDRLD